MDFALLYLSNFEEGLSYYQWDRKIIYDLKSKDSPGILMAECKERGLATEFIKENTKHYMLTELGVIYCAGTLTKYKNVFSIFNKAISELLSKGQLIDQIRRDLPILSFYYSNRKYKLILEQDDEEIYVKVILPSDLRDAINEVKISIQSVENSEFLIDILVANFKMFDKINLNP